MGGGQLVRGEQVEVGDAGAGVVGEGVQDEGEPVGEGLHGLGVEAPGVVLEAQVEAAAGLDDEGEGVVHGVVEGVSGDGDRAGGVGDAGGALAAGVVLEHHEGVEEFAVARVAGGALDVGEAEVLVVEERALFVLEPVEEPAQSVSGGPTQAGGQGVDEQADHRLDAVDGGVTSGDRRTEQHVLAARHPADEQAPGALDEGAEGDSAFAGAGGEPRGDAFGQLDADLGGFEGSGGCGGGDETGGLVDSGERGAPGGAGRLAVGTGDPAEVAAVGGDFGEGGGVLAVEGEEFAVQDGQGPAVRDDVMEREDQSAAVLAEADEGAADQRRVGEVEAVGAFVGGYGLGEGAADRGVFLCGQVDLVPGQFEAGGDELDRAAVGRLAEAGAQRGVPVDESLCGRAQQGAVDRAGQFDDLLHDIGVVFGAVHQGVEEEALLERAEGQCLFDGDGEIALYCVEFVLAQGPPRGGGRVVGRAGAGDGGEFGDRAVPEHVARGELQACPAGEDEEVDGDDTVAAEREEVVVDADRGDLEDPRVQVAEQSFAGGLGGAARAEQPGEVRDGQCGGVELAAGGDGQPVQRDEGGRDHVVGQVLGGVCPQGRHQGVDVAEGRGAVGERVAASGAVRRLCLRFEGELGVQAAVFGVPVPGERQLVAVPRGDLVQRLGVHAVRSGGRPAAVGEGVERGEVVGEAGVGDAGDARPGRAAGEQRVQRLHRTERGPGRVGGLLGCVRLGSQHDVVAVAGEFVVVGASLDPDVGGEAVEGGEVVGVDEEFALPGDGPVHGGALGFLVRARLVSLVARPSAFDGRAQGAQQAQVAYVADEHRAAGGEQFHGVTEHVGEVVAAGEVLDDGVDDDRVEVALGQSGEVVRGAGQQGDAVREFGDRGHLGVQGAYGFLGEVGAPVLGAVRGEPGQQQAGADADLQDAAGP